MSETGEQNVKFKKIHSERKKGNIDASDVHSCTGSHVVCSKCYMYESSCKQDSSTT